MISIFVLSLKIMGDVEVSHMKQICTIYVQIMLNTCKWLETTCKFENSDFANLKFENSKFENSEFEISNLKFEFENSGFKN